MNEYRLDRNGEQIIMMNAIRDIAFLGMMDGRSSRTRLIAHREHRARRRGGGFKLFRKDKVSHRVLCRAQ